MNTDSQLALGLAEYLEAQGVGDTDPLPVNSLNVAIRYRQLSQTDPDCGIAVRVFPTGDDERLPAGERLIQFWIRGTTDPTVVDDIAQSIFDALHMTASLDFEEVHVAYIKRQSTSAGTPMQDEADRYQRSDNYFAYITVPPTAQRPGN